MTSPNEPADHEPVRVVDCSHLINQPPQYARIHIKPRPGVDAWPVVERVRGGWTSGEHHYPDEMVLSVQELRHPDDPDKPGGWE